MKTRSELEALEQTDPIAFQKLVEKFAAGEYFDKDTIEGVIERMLDAAPIQCNLDTGCGETPCICRGEYFDRHLMFTDGNQMFMDADGILQGAK